MRLIIRFDLADGGVNYRHITIPPDAHYGHHRSIARNLKDYYGPSLLFVISTTKDKKYGKPHCYLSIGRGVAKK